MSAVANPRVLAARARRVEARERLLARISEAKHRMSPGVLAHDAVDGVRSKASEIASDGIEVVRERPWAAAAAAGVLGLFLARKPLARWVGGQRPDDADEDDPQESVPTARPLDATADAPAS